MVHAPTGIGKTAAVLSPCLDYALANGYVVYFLTSRHTQHKIAIDTIKKISEVNGKKIQALDIIGKKWLCLQPGISQLTSSEFSEFCKTNKESRTCDFYTKTYSKPRQLSPRAKSIIEDMKETIWHCEEIFDICKRNELCPYEVIMSMAEKADVIIADYYYLFNPRIQENILSKIQKGLDKSIIIVDEGHNLPKRIRELLSVNLSFLTLKRAEKEADKFKFAEAKRMIKDLQKIMKALSEGMKEGDEKLITRETFTDKVNNLTEGMKIEDYAEKLEEYGDEVLSSKRNSALTVIATFLAAWDGEDEGFARIFTMKKYLYEVYPSLSYRNLSPSVATSKVIKDSYSTILMSGTLNPTSMYKDILGFPAEASTIELQSPFPEKNRLNLIIPKTTTKYTARSEEQFQNISKILVDITDSIPGNSAVFFPSYSLRDNVYKYFMDESTRTSFLESPGLQKQEKQTMLEKFKQYKDSGAVLFGVASGSFGEGIDLPGDLLKGVIVVGLPLQKPDLETQELINYYDKKFSKGWEYGYVIPAFNTVLQNAGRCIRSQEDKGVIIFLDERYTWGNYFKHFPKEWHMKITELYHDRIKKFFDENGN